MEQALAIFFSVMDMFRKDRKAIAAIGRSAWRLIRKYRKSTVLCGQTSPVGLDSPDPRTTGQGVGDDGLHATIGAEYRDSFRYVIDVLKTLKQMRERSFPTLPELELNRLSNPFQTRRPHYPDSMRSFAHATDSKTGTHLRNPGPGARGERMTPILENLPKLSLYGFVPAELLKSC